MAKIIDLTGFPLPPPQPEDPLDRARHVFKKGRLEFMGGPLTYIQGHGAEIRVFNKETGQMENKELKENERVCQYPPLGSNQDPEAEKLGVDITGQ